MSYVAISSSRAFCCTAIFEMATLIEQAIAGDLESLGKASALQESIITVMLENPSCVTQIRNLLANGYAIEFSVRKRNSDNPNLPEQLSTIES